MFFKEGGYRNFAIFTGNVMSAYNTVLVLQNTFGGCFYLKVACVVKIIFFLWTDFIII